MRAIRIGLAVVFALLALNAFAQVFVILVGQADGPGMLTAWQVLIGVVATAAAWGSWQATRWAPGAAVAYGLITASMLVALEPLLDLDAGARRGLWVAAATILAFCGVSAWLLRRIVAKRDVDPRGARST